MIIIYFITGLCFGGVGLAAYLQLRQGGDFALKKQLPWLAAFGFMSGVTHWIDMFLTSGGTADYLQILKIFRMITQPTSSLLLLIFGWGILKDLTPLPPWTIFIPGILIVPISFVITYAATTFVTPSPIEIPIDIWSRYLLYLPGSVMAGIGFLRQWRVQSKVGFQDVATLMLGTGTAFLIEAFVVGLIVPAAPYGPASYYNYDRVIYNAFSGERAGNLASHSLMTSWLDYERVLEVTGLPIYFWRMLSAFIVTFFMVRGLGVFEAIRNRQLKLLQEERDRANQAAFDAQISARLTAENWTSVLVSINRRITNLEDVDDILVYIIENARKLLNSDFVGLALYNHDYSSLELKCYSIEKLTTLLTTSVIITNPFILQTLHTLKPYRSLKDEDPEMVNDVVFNLDKSALAVSVVPLLLENRPIGALWMARCEGNHYTETDLIWLDCMADQVVIAIQHGLMTSRLQSLSITEERARIAREMHDGLAQVLGYVNLQVQTLDALLKQGRHDALQQELGRMREAIRLAQADVRENILSLRTTLANERGLVSAIDEYLREFSIQTGINTQFENKILGNYNLSSIAEVQLVCILQEALANVRKHANATKVKVFITKGYYDGQECVLMKIIDDGVGFMSQDSKRRFGLQTMRERAVSVHGSLQIRSFPGKGTTIECKLPCLTRERMKRAKALPFHDTGLHPDN